MAARWREAAPRVLAELPAWRERLLLDAAKWLSLFRTPEIVRERVLDCTVDSMCSGWRKFTLPRFMTNCNLAREVICYRRVINFCKASAFCIAESALRK